MVVAQFRLRVRLGLRQCRNSTMSCLAKKDSLNFFGGPARIHRRTVTRTRARSYQGMLLSPSFSRCRLRLLLLGRLFEPLFDSLAEPALFAAVDLYGPDP